MTDVYTSRPVGMTSSYTTDQDRELLEMSAFEKGRVQGELEATRRLEAEGAMQLKTMAPTQHDIEVANMQKPDVIEINRLTNLQRGAFVLGELAMVGYIALMVVWLDNYRGNIGWSDDYAGDNIGNIAMYNTHLLCSALGLMFLSQAISNYRILPLNLNPWLNRAWYMFMQSAAIVCFTLSLVGRIKSTPETTFWSAADWCFALAAIISVAHGLYSMAVTLFETLMPVDYEHWAETNNRLETPEQARDHSAYNQYGRTLYTPAPVNVPRQSAAIPPANANVGAEVPVAPANAPRWVENPNTHAEDYWLLPRAKWAVVGFFAMGAAILMELAHVEAVLATGHKNWSQDSRQLSSEQLNNDSMAQNHAEARIVGSLCLCVLFSTACIAYMAMPPRTTLVKNGILRESDRRSSISHTAETRLGPNLV